MLPMSFYCAKCVDISPKMALETRSAPDSGSLRGRSYRYAHSGRRRLGNRKAFEGDDAAPENLDKAAQNFVKGLETGADAEELVASSLGASSASELSEVQEKYKDKVRHKLEERAEQLKKEREAKLMIYSQGKAAYARGQYPRAVELLEAARDQEGPFSQLGGEVQLWLAMAYAACGREDDCIAIYKSVEDTHPMPALRRQAADLRYIMEAPKLVLGEDEKVSIPVLSDLEPAQRSRASITRPAAGGKRSKQKRWDEEFWENYKAPVYLKNRYVWVAASVVALALAYWSSILSNR